jgi:hypothetical protein
MLNEEVHLIMKRISILMIAVFLFAGFAGFSHAAKSATAEGTIQKMDKSSITLQVGGEEKTFSFKKNMKITVNGKRPSNVNLKAGDKASVWADKDNVVERIDVTPQSAAAGSSN